MEHRLELPRPIVSPTREMPPRTFLLLVAIAVSFVINRRLALGMRLVDFLIMVFVGRTLLFRRISLTSEFALVSSYYLILIAGLCYGIVALGVASPQNFIYAYKYSMPFLFFMALRSYDLSADQTTAFTRVLVATFAFLCVYVFIHILLVSLGLLAASIRVAFPFTSPNERGYVHADAPLYSAFLSLGTMTLIFIHRLRLSGLRNGTFWVLIIVSLGANLATGSRTGLVAAVVGLSVLGFDETVRRIRHISKRRGVRPATIVLLLVVVVLAVSAFVVLVQRTAQQRYGVQYLIERTLNFELANDQSANARLIKAEYAFGTVWDHLKFIGIGMPSTTHDWFDIGISAIFFTGGILGTVVFFTILAVFLAKMHRRAVVNDQRLAFRALAYAFLSYGVSHVGAEYFLVTRSVVPFLLFIYLFSSVIDRKRV